LTQRRRDTEENKFSAEETRRKQRGAVVGGFFGLEWVEGDEGAEEYDPCSAPSETARRMVCGTERLARTLDWGRFGILDAARMKRRSL
jgi:hypothetical protein